MGKGSTASVHGEPSNLYRVEGGSVCEHRAVGGNLATFRPVGSACWQTSWRWGSDPVDLEQVVRRAIHTAGHDPHSKAATCDSQRETVARDLRPSVHTKKQANEPHWRPPGELDAATVRGQLALGRTPRQGNFDDPRTRKLLGRSPPKRSAQVRTGIAVQCRPPWTPVVGGVGGQLGGQPRDAGPASWVGFWQARPRGRWVAMADTHSHDAQMHRHEHTHVTQ